MGAGGRQGRGPGRGPRARPPGRRVQFPLQAEGRNRVAGIRVHYKTGGCLQEEAWQSATALPPCHMQQPPCTGAALSHKHPGDSGALGTARCTLRPRETRSRGKKGPALDSGADSSGTLQSKAPSGLPLSQHRGVLPSTLTGNRRTAQSHTGRRTPTSFLQARALAGRGAAVDPKPDSE